LKFEFLDRKRRALGIYIEREEDLWLLYTLLKRGDVVTMRTTRDVTSPEGGSGERVPMVLSVEVSSSEFQPFTNRLRIRGVIIEGPERYGLKGHYHTFSVQPGSYLEVYREEGWSDRELKRIDKYGKSTPRILAVSVDEDEVVVAEYSLIGLRTLYEKSLPTLGKAYESKLAEREERLREEAEEISSLVRRSGYKAIVIAGPPLWAEELANLLSDDAKRQGVNLIVEKMSHGGVKGLRDLESSGRLPGLLGLVAMRAAGEVLEKALRLLANSENRVAVGLEEVKRASEAKAVEKLLILDELLSTYDSETRDLIESILDSAEKSGGEIIIVPSASSLADKLRGLGGILALLRFEVSPRDTV